MFNHDSGKIWARWCGWQKSWDGDKTDQRQGGLDHQMLVSLNNQKTEDYTDFSFQVQ